MLGWLRRRSGSLVHRVEFREESGHECRHALASVTFVESPNRTVRGYGLKALPKSGNNLRAWFSTILSAEFSARN